VTEVVGDVAFFRAPLQYHKTLIGRLYFLKMKLIVLGQRVAVSFFESYLNAMFDSG
jgi:hypothetical protein